MPATPATSNSDYHRSLLAGLELFKGVRPDDVRTLLQQCDRRDVATGDTLLSPGNMNEHVYVVLSGGLNVHIGSADSPVLTTMEVGACAGEMSIIEDRDPSAYVIAAEPSHLLVIHKDVLWSLVDISHEFSKNLLMVLSERVRTHNNFIAARIGDWRELERHATTDALTGLGNRHAMDESFPRELQRCIQSETPVSLIMIDVDYFKSFNDKFGHVAGDRALAAVADVLGKQFRPRDLLVRYGGDEFAVLLPGVNQTEAVAIAERVRNSVSGSTGASKDSLIKIPVRISMGVADIDVDGSYENLLKDADAALYRAKHAGRDTVST